MQKRLSVVKELMEKVRIEISRNEETLTDEEVFAAIEQLVLNDERTLCFALSQKREIIEGIFYSTRKDLDFLQPYILDEEVSEIMVNGTGSIFIEQRGKLRRISQTFETTEELEEIIRRIAAKVHREINELNPILDARLADGSRVNAVYKNVALNGPILTIRKFPEKRIKMEDLLSMGSITQEAANFFKKVIEAGYNIFVSGGTSSGKTTFLNVLSNYIPKEERVITIEDSAELQITEIKNLVKMECKIGNVQGKGEINMRQLIRTSLRMRPDRIIVGEVRGAEVVDMIQALCTGHQGSLSTGHGNSPQGMVSRLEAMFLQGAEFPIESIRGQIAEAIDIIVHLGRLPDGSRRVLEITELEGYEDGKVKLNPLYAYKMEKGIGKLMATGETLHNIGKLEMKGIKL